MADYTAKTRSNYFKVKDSARFHQWAATRDIEVVSEQRNGERYYMMMPDEPDAGGWCRQIYDENTEDYTKLDLEGELAEHLQDGSVAVLMEVGSENLRWLRGIATAVNSKGEVVAIDLDDIYEAASHLGDETTKAVW